MSVAHFDDIVGRKVSEELCYGCVLTKPAGHQSGLRCIRSERAPDDKYEAGSDNLNSKCWKREDGGREERTECLRPARLVAVCGNFSLAQPRPYIPDWTTIFKRAVMPANSNPRSNNNDAKLHSSTSQWSRCKQIQSDCLLIPTPLPCRRRSVVLVC